MGLLAWAFASVARRSDTTVSVNWLTGWLLIVFHFFAFMCAPLSGFTGIVFDFLGVLTLVWAGLLFARASVPYRKSKSSMAMAFALLGSYTFYLAVLMLNTGTPPRLPLMFAAALLGVAPLAVALATVSKLTHFLRWATIVLHGALSVLLLAVQNRPNGGDIALNAILFTVYLVAAIHFWHMYRRRTAGAIITLVGFFLWANVFTVAPSLAIWYSQLHLESEVWNLPKYVVAVGMILVLLEDQIAHNKHLALHDALTGLPNRRLFQDRLTSALERARRTNTQAALLMLDLDHFKQVNDTMGHHVGDLLLQEVARLFSARIRRSDTIARTGGDEFTVILEGPTSRAEARHVARSLLNLLEEPLVLEGRQVHVAASLGVAIFPDDAPDLESLCIQADLRMYDNKRAGEKRVAIGPISESPVSASAQRESEAARY
ncbi:MAG TPA: GGDEF domain-containing protein [Terracidiphilus sp.]|jgi:diguanylate cyclase (GGDEF)-like protein